jgi:translation initiation factor 1A
MVKNAGGNKTKGQARKFASGGGKNDKLRISEDECEVYAMVEKMLGNGMCHVLCDDGMTRLCHIRGKFRGRGKRDNNVENGSWLLVGLREWDIEKKDETKMQNCDLLEVYQDRDRNELKTTVKNVKWRLFTKNEEDINNVDENADDVSDEEVVGFTFAENKNDEIDKLIAAELASKGTVTNIVMDNNDWISADDI